MCSTHCNARSTETSDPKEPIGYSIGFVPHAPRAFMCIQCTEDNGFRTVKAWKPTLREDIGGFDQSCHFCGKLLVKGILPVELIPNTTKHHS